MTTNPPEYIFEGHTDAKEASHFDSLMLVAGDVLAFWGAIIASHALLALVEPGSWIDNWFMFWNWESLPRLYIYFSLAVVGIAWFWGHLSHYTYSKPFWRETHDLWRVIAALAVVDLALKAVLRVEVHYLWWATTWASAFFSLPLLRYGCKRLLMRLGCWQKPTYIIGSGPSAQAAYQAISSDATMGCAFMKTQWLGTVFMHNIRSAATLLSDNVLHKLRGARIIFALERDEEHQLDGWLRRLLKHGVQDIYVIPPTRGIPLYGADTVHFFRHDVLFLHIQNNLARGFSRASKRALDLSAAAMISLILSPIMFYVYWRVRCDGGQAIFGHERIGKSGKPFKCFKFRTMVPDAAERLDSLLKASPSAREEWERECKLKEDPRVTSIGHFLRASSLDELPQLWNVIKGDMSLVGPRPVTAKELDRYGDDISYYYMTKPGVTGLWQVSGRNDIDYTTRVYLDVWYLKNWSFWYDMAILFRTCNVLFKRSGAY